MPSRAACPHCNTAFTPDAGAQLDDCPTCGRAVEVQPDHTADADKNVQTARCPHCAGKGHTDHDQDVPCAICQPAPAPSGWGIDTSAGREILVYDGCSVIEAEQARQVLAAMTATAPLPENVDTDLKEAKAVLSRVQEVLRNEDLLFAAEGLRSVFHALSHISDLTRRLAEGKAELALEREHSADLLLLAKSNKKYADKNKASAEAAEARVLEMEAGRDILRKHGGACDLCDTPQAFKEADAVITALTKRVRMMTIVAENYRGLAVEFCDDFRTESMKEKLFKVDAALAASEAST